ncbi:hypothetical protein PORY_001700 [Pneumocystis oryctolagi]|uniref:Uncharacterized protein n=1 Tax=Pneumocystis oryctolagi TaxID=42067 RepID=A0ACB7CCA2_9ASCO|nr:hypothetical protein PORY_001700 [Pneumocystis oryctolagi]
MDGLSIPSHSLLECILTEIADNDAHILGICAHIIDDLINYRPICSLSQDSTLWHTWHTRIQTLLRGKSPEKRWFGACLVKITAKQSPEGLFSHGTEWCQSLLHLLSNETCTTVVRRSCLTLLSIFVFSHGRPTYMRLFATPFLGSFLNNLVNLPSRHPSISNVCISCIDVIITLYPTICKPFVSNIKAMAIQVINEAHIDQLDMQESMFSVFSKLHCTAKDSGPEQWKSGILSCLWILHKIIDHFFHDSIQGPHFSLKKPEWIDNTFPNDFYEAFKIGLEKFTKYVWIIQLHLNQCTPYPIKIPAGQLFFFIYRVFNISDESNTAFALDNKEKSLLHAKIPYLHLIACKLLTDMIQILNSNILLHFSSILSQLNYIFSKEKNFIPLKLSIYNIFNMILYNAGTSISSYKSIDTILQEALNDLNQLLITSQSTSILSHKKESKKKRTHETLDIILRNSEIQKISSENVIKLALNVISSILNHLSPEILPITQRTLIDKTILSIALSPSLRKKFQKQVYDSLINNILSPGDVQAVILPHVIRIFQTSKETDILNLQTDYLNHTKLSTLDSILHPRFPPLRKKLKDQISEMDHSKSKILEETNKIYLKYLKCKDESNASEIIETCDESKTFDELKTYDELKASDTFNTVKKTYASNTSNACYISNACDTQETLSESFSLDIIQNTITTNFTSEQETKDFLKNDSDNIQNNTLEHIYKLSTETKEKNNTKDITPKNIETDDSSNFSDTEIPTIIMEDSSYEE